MRWAIARNVTGPFSFASAWILANRIERPTLRDDRRPWWVTALANRQSHVRSGVDVSLQLSMSRSIICGVRIDSTYALAIPQASAHAAHTWRLWYSPTIVTASSSQ